MWIIINERRDIFGPLHTQEYKGYQKADSEATAKWKEIKGKPSLDYVFF